MAQNMKRGRNNRRRQSTNVNRAMDSTGPDVKIRGTALQIHDKYQALARDAASAGDRVRAESLLQHAEHYFRVMKAMQPPQEKQNDPSDEPQPNVDGEAGSGNRAKKKSRDDNRNEQDQENSKADVSAEADSDDAADDGSDGDTEEAKPKRPRRRRSPRKSADADADAEGDDQNDSDGDDSKDKVPEVAAE